MSKAKSKKQYLPSVSSDSNVSNYISKISKFPILTEDEEKALIDRWKKSSDVAAAHQLVSSHLRIVPKIAYSYQGYGLPMMDVISEGNLGLMHAVKKFEPSYGYRFSTYAVWWIKASIQDYILRSWSLVKMGSSAANKKLFFNLKKLKNRIESLQLLEGSDIDENQYIADQLNLKKKDVDAMEQRLLGDASLNYSPAGDDRELMDTIEHDVPNQEVLAIEDNYNQYRSKMIETAMSQLNDREIEIVKKRVMAEGKPETLESLSKRFGVSKERIRQIEARALEKLKGDLNNDL